MGACTPHFVKGMIFADIREIIHEKAPGFRKAAEVYGKCKETPMKQTGQVFEDTLDVLSLVFFSSIVQVK